MLLWYLFDGDIRINVIVMMIDVPYRYTPPTCWQSDVSVVLGISQMLMTDAQENSNHSTLTVYSYSEMFGMPVRSWPVVIVDAATPCFWLLLHLVVIRIYTVSCPSW